MEQIQQLAEAFVELLRFLNLLGYAPVLLWAIPAMFAVLVVFMARPRHL